MANGVEPRYVVGGSTSGNVIAARLAAAGKEVLAGGGRPGLLRDTSSFDPSAFDLHFLPYGPTRRGEEKRWSCGVAALQPRSRGHMPIMSRNLKAKPLIDHRFLGDAAGHGARAPTERMEQLHAIAAGPARRNWPVPAVTGIRSEPVRRGRPTTLVPSSVSVAGRTAWPGAGSRWKTNNLIEPLRDARCSNVGRKFSL